MVTHINEMVAVDEYAKDMGMSSDQVIMGIREGDYIGELTQGEWFVLPSSIDNGIGPSIDEIVNAIKNGIYEGVNVNGNWYVLCSSVTKRIGLSIDEIVAGIREGVFVGQKVNGEWFVSPSSIATEKKPIESDFSPIKKKLFLCLGIPPSLGMFIEGTGYRNYTDTELVAMFIFGALFILMLSWIVTMFSYSFIVRSRICSNIHSSKFSTKVWLLVFTWVAMATVLGYLWNDIAIENWLETNNHKLYFSE